MSEHAHDDTADLPEEQPGHASGHESVDASGAADPGEGDQVRTGVPEVDDVLASVEGLDETSVDDHVAVFESAHDRLRRALDGNAAD